MEKAALTKEKPLALVARINEESEVLTLVFKNADGTDHAIDSYDFELVVKRSPNASSNLFTLSVGDGLNITGASNHKLQIQVSAARATGRRAESNFYQLRSTAEDHTWFGAPFKWINGTLDEDLDLEATITIGTTEVTITLENTAVDFHNRGDFDASAGDAPTDGGSGIDGAIKARDEWRISVGCADWLSSGVPAQVGEFIKARIDNPAGFADWAKY